MFTVASHTEGFPFSEFPTGLDARWETERRALWNEKQHTSEECDLVYEISWIAEIGVWRRFLRFRQKVNG
jgi:hypothetical protein